MACKIHIGTSGWHYKHWRGRWYPENLPAERMLPYYARHFDTVEVNNSFYRLPTTEALASWRDATPAGFCFAVKGSRYLTHMKKLKDPESGLETFLPRVKTLGSKLGPILFQLPPGWKCNTDRLGAFLQALPSTNRYSFEFRDPSWHTHAVYDLLRRHNAAFCQYELAGFQSPIEVTADFAYVRLHGPLKAAYQGRYSKSSLRIWAKRIEHWKKSLKHVYVYFDNDQAAFAPRNASELRQM